MQNWDAPIIYPSHESIQQPAIPAHIYRYILDFIDSRPPPEQILDFRPTAEMCDRLQTLLTRNKTGEINPSEQQELDE